MLTLEATPNEKVQSILAVVDVEDDVERCTLTCDESTTAASTSIVTNPSFKNSCCDHHFMLRLTVKPLTLFPSTAVTPIRHLKHYCQKLPQHLRQPTLSSPLLSKRTEYQSNKYSVQDPSEQNRMNDEWNDIWPQVRIFIRQNALMQELKQENLVSFGLLLICFVYLYIGLFSSTQLIDFAKLARNDSDYDEEVLLLLLIYVVVTVLMCGVVFYMYTKFGDANFSKSNELVKLLVLIVFSWFIAIWMLIILHDYYETGESDWHWYYVSTVTMSTLSYLVIVILGIVYHRKVANIVVYRGRHDEALQKIHDEIKCISTGLSYFVLHPTIRNDKSNVMVEVYFKTKSAISLSQPQLPLSSVSMSKPNQGVSDMVSGANRYAEDLPVY